MYLEPRPAESIKDSNKRYIAYAAPHASLTISLAVRDYYSLQMQTQDANCSSSTCRYHYSL